MMLLAWSCNISEKTNTPKAVLVVHGGAGYLTTHQMSDSLELAVQNKISEALLAGQKHLVKGGSSVEAVQIAINILEDAPLFNAGKGACKAFEVSNPISSFGVMVSDTVSWL